MEYAAICGDDARRDGAAPWRLFRDSADPTRHLEIFLAESRAEHMRQHERFSVAERAIEQRARVFHAKATPLVITHLISASAVNKNSLYLLVVV